MHLLISRRYLEQMTVNSITPQAAQQTVDGDNIELTIPVSSASGAVVVQLSLSPEGMGSAGASIATAGGASVAFSQFLYP